MTPDDAARIIELLELILAEVHSVWGAILGLSIIVFATVLLGWSRR